MPEQHDLIVIGAGPGGYVAAIRAAQLGLNVACVDKNAALGGTCLRVGCIPSKALLESSELYHQAQHDFADHGIGTGDLQLDLAAMLKRKDKVVKSLTDGVAWLLDKNKIARYHGTGHLREPGKVTVEDADGKATKLQSPHIVIATGSVSATLPGVELDGDRIGDSTTALSYDQVPERLVVIGAGYIGLELGSVWSRLGAKVTVLEYLEGILPGMDSGLAKQAQKLLKRQGLTFQLGARVTGAEVKDGEVRVKVDGRDDVVCDRVLVAVGRKPNLDGIDVEALGLEQDKRGHILVDERYRTNVEGIHAIGDVIPGPMLAHLAEEEGVACVEFIAGGHGHVDYHAIPGVCYTSPEIASVGRTEDALKEADASYRTGTFNIRANGRARALGQTDGTIKILADTATDRVLGIHIIAPRAGDLIAEATAAMAFGATAEDIALTCHAHPTLPECLKEAALDVDGRAIHQ